MSSGKVTAGNGAGTWSILRRAARAHAVTLAAVASLTVLLALVAVVTPQLSQALLTRALRYDAGQATPLERDFTTTFVGAPSSPGDGSSGTPSGDWSSFRSDLADVRASMPGLLKGSTSPAEFVTTSAKLPIEEFPGGLSTSFVALGAGPELLPHVRFVTGRAPTARTPAASGVMPGDAGHPLEMALSRSTAAALHWNVGATHTLDLPDGSTLDVRLTGAFVAHDAADAYWGHVFQTLQPEIQISADGGRIPIGTGWLASSGLSALKSLPDADYTSSLVTTAWFPLRTTTLTPAESTALATDSRRFTAVRHSVASAGSGPLSLTTHLSAVLAASQARGRTATALMAADLAGPLGAAVALELLVARLALARADEALRLAGSRGAGRRGLRVIAGGLVGGASLPAAAVGCGAGILLARAAAARLAVPPTELTWPIAVTALVAAALPAALVSAGVPRLLPRVRAVPVRPIAEGVVLAAAAVSVLLVAREGLAGSAASSGVDPVAALLPLTLALAGCVVALRVMPAALARARRRAVRRRGVSLSTGLAVAARSRSGLGAPLLAATTGLAVALFAVVLGSTLRQGLDDAARARVGADVSVATSSVDYTTKLPFAKLPGVEAVSFVSDTASTQITVASRAVNATIIVVDPQTLRAVQQGLPGAIPLPAGLSGSAARSVPVVASSSLAGRIGAHPSIDGTPLRVIATAPDVTSFAPTTDSWILVGQTHASLLSTDNAAPDQTLLRVDPGADPELVAARARSLVGSTAGVTTANEVAESLERNPLVPGIRLVALEAAVLGALFGAAALVATALLETTARRRRIRLLTLLGLDRHQRRRLVVAETLPLGLTALAAGLVTAALVVALVLPSADLRSFTGSSTRPEIRLDPPVLAVVIAGAAAAVTLVSVLAARLAGRPLAARPDTEDAE